MAEQVNIRDLILRKVSDFVSADEQGCSRNAVLNVMGMHPNFIVRKLKGQDEDRFTRRELEVAFDAAVTEGLILCDNPDSDGKKTHRLSEAGQALLQTESKLSKTEAAQTANDGLELGVENSKRRSSKGKKIKKPFKVLSS